MDGHGHFREVWRLFKVVQKAIHFHVAGLFFYELLRCKPCMRCTLFVAWVAPSTDPDVLSVFLGQSLSAPPTKPIVHCMFLDI